MILSTSRVYDVDNRVINECGTASGKKIYRRNQNTE
jgi:hypothetical protein